MADHEDLWDFAVAPPRTAPGVTSMVGYRALSDPDPAHRGLPSSRLTFIVSLDDGVEAAADAEGLERAAPAPLVLGGLHLTASHVRQRRDQAGVQLAVHPLAARGLFGVPSAALSVTDFDASDFFGRRGRSLHGRVSESADWNETFREVRSFLLRRVVGERISGPRPELAHAWHLLERTGGRASIASIADRVGLSSRHLGTLFRREVGRSPKAVAELMRFERTVALLSDAVRRTGRVSLAEAAAEAGYADQAHLSRDFTRYAGLSPRRWLAAEFRNIQDGGHSAAAQWMHD